MYIPPQSHENVFILQRNIKENFQINDEPTTTYKYGNCAERYFAREARDVTMQTDVQSLRP